MDEEFKKLIESRAAETRRHFDVVAERLEWKIDIISEGVVSANERITRLETKVGVLQAISQTDSTKSAP